MHERPRVAVIVPNHNYGHWIEGCLDSISNDDYDNKTIVVVDDGSTDNSVGLIYELISNPKEFICNGISGVCGTYKKTEFKIKLISCSPSKGPSSARNIGIKVSFEDSDLFSFIDSDDIHISGKLKKTVDVMVKNYEYVGVVYCDYENDFVSSKRVHQQYKEPFCSERILVECTVPSHSLVSKHAIDSCGFFDEEMRVAEDWDLWIRISKKFMFYHMPEKLVVVRTGKYNSANVVSKDIWAKNWIRIREKIDNDM